MEMNEQVSKNEWWMSKWTLSNQRSTWATKTALSQQDDQRSSFVSWQKIEDIHSHEGLDKGEERKEEEDYADEEDVAEEWDQEDGDDDDERESNGALWHTTGSRNLSLCPVEQNSDKRLGTV